FTVPGMALGSGGLLVLAPLRYMLPWGALRFPARGPGGPGYGSAVMRGCPPIACASYRWRRRRFADRRRVGRFEPQRWAPIRRLLAAGLPIGVTVAMEGGLFVVTALLIGRLGELPAAAHQIAINVASLCFMVPMGLAEATTVRVGHA